ncbi:heterokaryon incompatibility protein-domain-containing protein, partial [Microdochium bolleyi]
MPLFAKARDVAAGFKIAAASVAYVGNMAAASYRRGRDGICSVCNNLQPDGHENTFGRVGDALLQSDATLAARRSELGAVPTLVLTNIHPKDVLKSREVDPQTGQYVSNCKYCRLLCDIFDHFFIDEWMSWITETKNGMPVKVGLMIRQGMPLVINCWEFEYDKWFKTSRCDLELYMDPMPAAPIAGAPAMGPAGRRPADVRSEESMWFIKHSLAQCCHEHPQCGPPKGVDFVPTRLVYIGRDNDSLRLHETTGEDAGKPWVALSHCWGESTPLSLTQENLARLKEKITWSDLPNTFKDAITLARHLSIFHIWIDCLCIIQNSENGLDWQREAALMGSIYQYSFIVICTSASKNAQVPVLRPREQDWLPKQFD